MSSPSTSDSTATADLLDGDPDGLVSCRLPLRHFGARRSFAGAITTVRSPGDTVLLKRILAEQGTGRVLVVDGDGSDYAALLGDRTAAMAAGNGWEGLVINGVVRDVEALAGVEIGVLALGSNPRKPAQDGTGRVDVPVSFGDVTFWPGAPVWADADGVVTVAHAPAANMRSTEHGW